MARKITFNTLELLTHDELKEAVIKAAKKKNKSLARKKNMQVNFRWGDPIDNIFATVDEIKEIVEVEEEIDYE